MPPPLAHGKIQIILNCFLCEEYIQSHSSHEMLSQMNTVILYVVGAKMRS